MKPRELKLHLLDKLAQVVVFDREGKILESCHSLINFGGLIGKSAYDTFPILGSMREVIRSLAVAGKPMSIPRVELAFRGLTGVFDFELYVHPDNDDWVIWFLIDQTQIYEYLRKIQQERNILLVEKEDRESGRDIDRWGMAG